MTSLTPKCHAPTGWEEHQDTLATTGCQEEMARMEKMDKRGTKESQVGEELEVHTRWSTWAVPR